MLALGASRINKPDHLTLAEELGETCFSLYQDQPTGIGPEKVRFGQTLEKGETRPSYSIISGSYYLRPGNYPSFISEIRYLVIV